MYNKLHVKDNKTGKINISFHGNIATEKLSIRSVVKFDCYIHHVQDILSKREVRELIEYLQEFERLNREGE